MRITLSQGHSPLLLPQFNPSTCLDYREDEDTAQRETTDAASEGAEVEP